MNFIENIEIKNFKSIRHAKIEGCKRINVFVGPPNVGKSNILEGLGLYAVTENQNSRPIADFVRLGKLATLFYNGYIDAPAQIIINAYNRLKLSYNQDFIHGKFEIIRNIEVDSFGEAETRAEQQGFFDHEREKEILPDSELRITKDRLFHTQRESGFSIIHADAESTDRGLLIAHGKRKRIPTYLYKYKQAVEYRTSTSSILLPPYGENIFDIISSYRDLKIIVNELFEIYGLKFLYETSEASYKIMKFDNENTFTVPYDMTADTLKRLIFHKAAIMSNKNTVLLFEEPESHMYPVYISKFTGQMMYDTNNNQFFLATHSPYVLSDLLEQVREDVSIYICSYVNGETVIQRMTDDEVFEAAQMGYSFFWNLENFVKKSENEI